MSGAFFKAFDTVKHNKPIRALRRCGVGETDIRVMAQLYWEQRAVLRVGEEVSEWVNIERGVRQRCVLSSDLFSLYTQMVMEEIKEMEGVIIGEQNENHLRIVENKLMIADS